jgi:hypothetical protein
MSTEFIKNYSFNPVTPQMIIDTHANWKEGADADLFSVEYSRFFEEALPNSIESFFALSLNDTGVILAFVELISSEGARKTKLVRVTVQPSLQPLEDHGNQSTLIELYFAAIRHTFRTAHFHGVSEIKVYGRTDHLLKILQGTSDLLDSSPMADFGHILQSRWLTFYAK